MGLGKALLEKQKKERNDRDDDAGKDREPLGMRVVLSKALARPSI